MGTHSTYQLHTTTMLLSMSYHFLFTFFFIVSVSHANPLDRKRTGEKRSGIPQEVVLGAGREIVLKNEGFEEEFIEGCTTLYEVKMGRSLTMTSTAMRRWRAMSSTPMNT